MGDDGHLQHLYSEIRRHNPEGDLLTIQGRVIGKRQEKGQNLVDLELVARNQDDELSIKGTATVALLSRAD